MADTVCYGYIELDDKHHLINHLMPYVECWTIFKRVIEDGNAVVDATQDDIWIYDKTGQVDIWLRIGKNETIEFGTPGV